MLRSMRTRSWATMSPQPMMTWPTSELPICPSGRPTAGPLASRVVNGCSANSRSRLGVRARASALCSGEGLMPTPSRMTRTVGRQSGMAGAGAAGRPGRSF